MTPWRHDDDDDNDVLMCWQIPKMVRCSEDVVMVIWYVFKRPLPPKTTTITTKTETTHTHARTHARTHAHTHTQTHTHKAREKRENRNTLFFLLFFLTARCDERLHVVVTSPPLRQKYEARLCVITDHDPDDGVLPGGLASLRHRVHDLRIPAAEPAGHRPGLHRAHDAGQDFPPLQPRRLLHHELPPLRRRPLLPLPPDPPGEGRDLLRFHPLPRQDPPLSRQEHQASDYPGQGAEPAKQEGKATGKERDFRRYCCCCCCCYCCCCWLHYHLQLGRHSACPVRGRSPGRRWWRGGGAGGSSISTRLAATWWCCALKGPVVTWTTALCVERSRCYVNDSVVGWIVLLLREGRRGGLNGSVVTWTTAL